MQLRSDSKVPIVFLTLVLLLLSLFFFLKLCIFILFSVHREKKVVLHKFCSYYYIGSVSETSKYKVIL